MTAAPTSVSDPPPSSLEGQAPPRTTQLRPILFVAGVFLFGAIAGAAVSRAYSLNEQRPKWGASPSARAAVRLDAMKRGLDLDDNQAKDIGAVILKSEEERESVMAPCRPGLDAWREKSDAAIREKLTPSQQGEFDELRKSWQKK